MLRRTSVTYRQKVRVELINALAETAHDSLTRYYYAPRRLVMRGRVRKDLSKHMQVRGYQMRSVCKRRCNEEEGLTRRDRFWMLC